MKYSFTQPLPKSIISHITKIWIFYIVLSIGLIYGYGIYLNYQINTIKSHTNISNTDIDAQDANIKKASENLRIIKSKVDLDTQTSTHNGDVALALEKIFALIPNAITINYMELQENALIFKGITPSREQYSFLLEAPLRAVFHKTRADFYALPNGWFNFTSISTNEENIAESSKNAESALDSADLKTRVRDSAENVPDSATRTQAVQK